MTKISVIIPVLNEAENIEALLAYLHQNSNEKLISEILVIDGGSSDGSQNIVSGFSKKHPKVIGINSPKGRAKQMNFGAAQAKGSILYFLHADSFPPKNFDQSVVEAIREGAKAGCFKMKFDSSHWWLQLTGWFTQFNWKVSRGGDQSLFVEKNIFEHLKGYNEDFMIYEDNEFIYRLYKQGSFKVIQRTLTTSARRFEFNGIWRLQFYFIAIHLKKFFGASPKKLEAYYIKHIH
ncbi:MAG: TIGR04283 family arsenosugar biosynthesis glycosyltransferase [Flavobacteriaceae bacterium]|jgi:rSAM/selenodomain-associated transferase 2|nr:TIGR04283 family arsenosugar biosynthesis glycosyltransferase [Flavobacteriaceae bacterium]